MIKKAVFLAVSILVISIILAYLETNLFFLRLLTKKNIPRNIAAHENLEISEKIDYKSNANLTMALEKYGAANIINNLVNESEGGSVFDCHSEAHRIGRFAYELRGEGAFAECTASCHSGCYHGAMEALLNKEGTENLAGLVKNTCARFDTIFGYFECLHGLGHGLLAYLNYDLPGGLETCKKLKDSFSIKSCYGGTFMENVVTGLGQGAEGADHKTEWLSDDPYFPCNAVSKDYDIQYQCYQMQTSWMMELVEENFDTVKENCLRAPKNMIGVCFKSYGRDAAGRTLRNKEKIVELCSKVSENYRDFCAAGAVHAVIDFSGPELKDQATELCNLFEGSAKKTCYQVLASRLTTLFNDKYDRGTVCQDFEPEFQKWCHFPWTLINFDRW